MKLCIIIADLFLLHNKIGIGIKCNLKTGMMKTQIIMTKMSFMKKLKILMKVKLTEICLSI